MNIIVLTGGTSSERNVTLPSGKAIAAALKNVKIVDPIYGTAQPGEEMIFEGRQQIGQEFPTAEEFKTYSTKKVMGALTPIFLIILI